MSNFYPRLKTRLAFLVLALEDCIFEGLMGFLGVLAV